MTNYFTKETSTLDSWIRIIEDRLDLIVWYLSTTYNIAEDTVWYFMWILTVSFIAIYLHFLVKLIRLFPTWFNSEKKKQEANKTTDAKEEDSKDQHQNSLVNRRILPISEEFKKWLKELRLQSIEVLDNKTEHEIKIFLKNEEINDARYMTDAAFHFPFQIYSKIFFQVAGKPHLQKLIQQIDEERKEIPIEEFFEIRQETMLKNRNNKETHLSWTYSGIYILHNRTNDKYYVGQSTNMFRRIPAHFKNEGSPAVYASYDNGDEWYIKTVLHKDTLFHSLDALERIAIHYYKSYENGYNRTSGNFI